MRAAALVVLCGISSGAFAQTADMIREIQGHPDPRDSFLRGVERRHDTQLARPEFREAAEDYGLFIPSPHVALNRGRAHYLADELPQAIRAFRDGLELAPWDADLQRGLAVCRAKVAYPTEATPAERVRPDPVASLRNRVAPTDLLVVTAVCSLLLTVGLARRFTTEDSWSTPVAAAGLVGLLLALAMGIVIDQQNRAEREHPVLVVTADTVLRTGNGFSFPARADAPLPRGAEVRELGRRGGWVQVELPGGAVGWLPETSMVGAAGRER
jgi:hypothetical protein